MKIAASTTVAIHLQTGREVVTRDNTDFTDVAAVVLSVSDSRSGVLAQLRHIGFNLPIFIALDDASQAEDLPGLDGVLSGEAEDASLL